MKSILKYSTLVFLIILSIGIFMRLYVIGRSDLYKDDSIYATRAFGWVDYIGPGQKGPAEWLGHTDWWTNLSFQDAPPTVFAMEHISMKMFGENATGAQLPGVLAGILSICVVFWGMRQFKDSETALWSATVFTVSSFALWSHTSGYLEAVESLFLVLGFFSAVFYLEKGHARYLYAWSAFIALALLTKYTAIFAIPAFIIGIYYKHDSLPSFVTYRKREWKALVLTIVIAVAILSPVIIYNYESYKLRGTFDWALSSMLGMKNDTGNAPSINFVQNSIEVVRTLFEDGSLPFILAFFASVVWLAVKSQKKQTDTLENLLVTNILMMFVMFGFMGAGIRHLQIVLPFFAMAIGIGMTGLIRRYPGLVTKTVICIVLVLEFTYTLNTNILLHPIGKEGVSYSALRNQSFGCNELDQYMQKILSPLPRIYTTNTRGDIEGMNDPERYTSGPVVMYDGRVDWFPSRWYFERYRLYYHLPVFSSNNKVLQKALFPMNQAQTNSTVRDYKPSYFIYALDPRVMGPDTATDSYYSSLDRFATALDTQHTPSVTIIAKDGTPAFRVYEVVDTFKRF